MLRRTLLLVAVAVAVATVPATASAHHVTVSAAIEGRIGAPLENDLVANPLTWTATCSDPEALIDFSISRRLQPKDRAKPEKVIEEIRPNVPRQGAGRGSFRVPPGERWRLAIEVTCSGSAEDGERHEAETTAYSQVLYRPPVIRLGYVDASFCTKGPPGPGVMQVGMPFGATIEANFDAFSMLRGQSKDVVLRVQGGGVNVRRRGEVGRGFRFPRPRKPGRVRYWLEFDGDRSEVLSMRVLPIRRGCR